MFKVFTEDTGGSAGENLATQYFDSFSVFRGIGCWRGTFEKTQCFEIDTFDAVQVFEFAKALKAALKQTTVLVVELHSTSVLV